MQRRNEHKLINFFKIISGLSPDYLAELLPQRVGDNLQYTLRYHNDFVTPLCRLDVYKKSFFPSSIALWNSLPDDVKEIN